MRILILALGLSIGLAACSPASESDAERSASEISFISSDEYKEKGYPFSKAVETDGLIFLAGELGVGPDQTLVAGGIGPESRQTMENIKATLAAQGLGMDRVVKCTAMLADMAEWPAFNEVYKEFFEDDYPARSAFGTSGLALNARIEIECIAKR